MATWPASLPQDMGRPVNIKHQSGSVRSQMDTGPAKMRNRFTAVSRQYETQLTFTGAQLKTFYTFFEDTLGHGAASFDWTDPVYDTTVSLRFLVRPQETMVRGDPDSDKREYQVAMALEQLP